MAWLLALNPAIIRTPYTKKACDDVRCEVINPLFHVGIDVSQSTHLCNKFII